jgi:hypothetical protein
VGFDRQQTLPPLEIDLQGRVMPPLQIHFQKIKNRKTENNKIKKKNISAHWPP